MNILLFLVVMVGAGIVARYLTDQFLLPALRLSTISNGTLRHGITAATFALAATAAFALVYASLATPYSLATFVKVWAVLSVLEYLLRPKS